LVLLVVGQFLLVPVLVIGSNPVVSIILAVAMSLIALGRHHYSSSAGLGPAWRELGFAVFHNVRDGHIGGMEESNGDESQAQNCPDDDSPVEAIT